jgi:hypothetical protein
MLEPNNLEVIIWLGLKINVIAFFRVLFLNIVFDISKDLVRDGIAIG